MKHEIEAHIRIHLAGLIACELRFKEHASNASHDIAIARDLATSMVNDYGMGHSLIASDGEIEGLLKRLYDETHILLERYDRSVNKIDDILSEYEHISKALAQEVMHDVL